MENFIEVYDDIMEPYAQDFIEKYLTCSIPELNFSWSYVKGLTDGINNEIGFSKNLIDSKNNFNFLLLSPLYNLSQSKQFFISNISSFRTFLQTPSLIQGSQKPHLDSPLEHCVCLYYVTDSDGDTIFYDKEGKEFKRVSPKKGRIVFFNGNISHSGSFPLKSTRIVINYNFSYCKLI